MRDDLVNTETPPATGTRRGAAILLALGLAVLAPICAEFIQAYDTSTGNPRELLASLVLFVPLYGAPAVLIREAARRFGVGWSGILALATGFGVLQAGVIDQSLFLYSDPRFADWEATVAPTWIEPLGLSGNAFIGFVIGHTIWSFTVPIALTENLNPRYSRAPWLRWLGLLLFTGMYLWAAKLIFSDVDPALRASTGQLIGAGAVFVLLAVFAFTLGRRRRTTRPRRVGLLTVLVLVATVVSLALNFAPVDVVSTLATVALLLVTAVALYWLSGSNAWSNRQVAAVATGFLAGRAIGGFFAEPIGDSTALEQLGHNLTFLVMTVALGWWTMTRPRRLENPAPVGDRDDAPGGQDAPRASTG